METEGQAQTMVENEVRERSRTFAHRLIGSMFKNMVLKTVLWMAVFGVAGFLYAKGIFQGSDMPEFLRTAGWLAALMIYLPGGFLTGLCFGALAVVKGITQELSEIVGSGVSTVFVKVLPEDRETVSLEEVRRILDRVAPPERGLSGLPLRLVREKVERDLLSRPAAQGSSALRVADVKEYVTGRLAGAAVGDIRVKARIGSLLGWFLILVFLVLPPVLVLLF